MEKLNSNKWSYLAGLVDGEGTICISQSQNKNGTTIFNIYLKVANTSLVLMQWLISNFGGQYHVSHAREGCKIQYAWSPKGKTNRKEVLLNILPFLVIKRAQAIIALEFDAIYERNGCQPGLKLTTDNPLYIENHKKREELRVKLCELNHRGTKD